MKILIASDLHWPTINGVATFSRTLAQGLAARGHDILVIAPSQTGRKYKEVDDNHPVYRTRSVPFPFYQNFRISINPQREVKKIIEEFEPDVIHIQMLMWIGQAAMRYGNKAGIPIVSTNHAMPENLLDNLRLLAPVARPINYMLKEYGRRFHSKSDCVTMPTQSAIDMFDVELPKPMLAISNGINLSRFKPGKVPKKLYKTYKIPENRQIITYVGRLDAEKHLWLLVKAFAKVRRGRDVQLVIVGDGTDSDNLKELVREMKLVKRTTFTGRVPDEDLTQLHRIGTVFAMPSPAELQSIALLEAMASGKPTVAVDAGALKELCQDGVNGELCEQDNVEQMATALAKILDDEKLAKKYGEKSLEIAKTHDIEYTLDRFEEVYRNVME